MSQVSRYPFDAVRLVALLKTAGVQTDASEAVQREGGWCDIRRRQNPQLAKAGDPEVILRVHRSWWHEAQKRNQHHRRDGLSQSCARMLRSLGWEDKAASEWAKSIFAEPDYFRLVLSELRNDAVIEPI